MSTLQPSTDDRQAAYLGILHCGLLRIRELAHGGHTFQCEVEADHLHNIPSLINEGNESRHDYYMNTERQTYLNAVDRTLVNSDFVLARYKEFWSVLSNKRND